MTHVLCAYLACARYQTKHSGHHQDQDSHCPSQDHPEQCTDFTGVKQENLGGKTNAS